MNDENDRSTDGSSGPPNPPPEATAPPSPQTSKKKVRKRVRQRFDPRGTERRVRESRGLVVGAHDVQLKAAESEAERRLLAFQRTVQIVAERTGEAHLSEAAFLTACVGVRTAYRKVSGNLKATPEGLALHRRTRNKDPWLAAKSLLGVLPPSVHGVPLEVLGTLREAMVLAAPLKTERDAASEAKTQAEAAFGEAKARVEEAVRMVTWHARRVRMELRLPLRKPRRAKKPGADSTKNA